MENVTRCDVNVREVQVLQVTEKQLPRSFTVRAAEKFAGYAAKFIEWFADVPLLALLVYFDVGLVVLAWCVLSPLLKHFSEVIAKATTMAGMIALLNLVANWPLMILLFWLFDTMIGGIIWTIACLVLNYYVLVWYKRSKEDWFGAEWLRAKEDLTRGWFGGTFKYFLQTGRIFAFLILSLFVDPIYAFIYQRGRLTGTGFTAGDWGIFAAANVVGVLPYLAAGIIAMELLPKLW